MRTSLKTTSFIFLAFLIGCADVTSISRNESKVVKLNPNSKTYIGIPKDGQYGSIHYAGSGRTVAGIVMSAFARKMFNLQIADHHETFEQALKSAKNKKYVYMIYPEITHWEDRNTAWSGRPSKASIVIRIVDVPSGKIIDSAVINARSSAFRMTDPSPEDALPEPVGQYVNSFVFE